MIHFLLYNAGLELLSNLPRKILRDSAINNDRQRRGKPVSKILLDLAVHQSALTKELRTNRGRPDILHQCLLQYLFSQLIHPAVTSPVDTSKSSIACTVHTSSDYWFSVNPVWRPPTHFFRFRGLMEQFLDKKYLKVGTDQKIQLREGNLQKVLQKLNPTKLWVFTSTKQVMTYSSLLPKLCAAYKSKERIICLIGAYQHGPPPEELLNHPQWKNKIEYVTLPGDRLPSWKTLSLTLSALEFSC